MLLKVHHSQNWRRAKEISIVYEVKKNSNKRERETDRERKRQSGLLTRRSQAIRLGMHSVMSLLLFITPLSNKKLATSSRIIVHDSDKCVLILKDNMQ